MKLSTETISVLKNFGAINQGIMFKKGKTLKTVSSHKNILAEVTIKEDIPAEFGVYDLPCLLIQHQGNLQSDQPCQPNL